MAKRKKPTRTVKINHKHLKFDEDGTPYIHQSDKMYKAKQVEIDDEEYFVVKHMGLTTWVEIDYAEL